MKTILFLLILICFALMGFLYYRFCQKTAVEFLNIFKNQKQKGGEKINAGSGKNYVKSAK